METTEREKENEKFKTEINYKPPINTSIILVMTSVILLVIRDSRADEIHM